MPIPPASVRFGDAFRITFQKKGQYQQRTRTQDLNKIPDAQAVKTLEEMSSVQSLLGQFLEGIGVSHTFRYVVQGRVDELFLMTNTGKRKSHDEYVQIRREAFQAQKDQLKDGDLHNVNAMEALDKEISKKLVDRQITHQDDDTLTIHYHTFEKDGKTLIEIDNPEKLVKTLRINIKEVERMMREKEEELKRKQQQAASGNTPNPPKP